MKTQHAELLNALDAIQCNPIYVLRRSTLSEAEQLIVNQEEQIKALQKEVEQSTLELMNQRELVKHWRSKAASAESEGAAADGSFAWAAFADNGNVIIWSRQRSQVEPVAAKYGKPVVPVIALPPSAAGAGSEQDERVLFEAYCIRHGYSVNKWQDGVYADARTENGWMFWQAHAAHQAATNTPSYTYEQAQQHAREAVEADRKARPASAQPVAAAPALTVWEGPMPESNGRQNYTAVLHRKESEGFDLFTDGFQFARSEYPDRTRYEADFMRWLIGEREVKPELWDDCYDMDKHSGYVKPAAPAAPVAQATTASVSDERAGWEAAAKELRVRAQAHHKRGDFDLHDECMQCSAMLNDLKPASKASDLAQHGASHVEKASAGDQDANTYSNKNGEINEHSDDES